MNEKIKSSFDIPSAFFNELYTIAKNDQNVMLLSADQGAWALEKFKENLDGQFYNLGVSEQHLISVSAGLSLTEKKVLEKIKDKFGEELKIVLFSNSQFIEMKNAGFIKSKTLAEI